MIKKQLLILLILLSSLAGYSQTTITPQWKSGTGYILVFYPGKSPAGYDSLFYLQSLRAIFKNKADSVNNSGYATNYAVSRGISNFIGNKNLNGNLNVTGGVTIGNNLNVTGQITASTFISSPGGFGMTNWSISENNNYVSQRFTDNVPKTYGLTFNKDGTGTLEYGLNSDTADHHVRFGGGLYVPGFIRTTNPPTQPIDVVPLGYLQANYGTALSVGAKQDTSTSLKTRDTTNHKVLTPTYANTLYGSKTQMDTVLRPKLTFNTGALATLNDLTLNGFTRTGNILDATGSEDFTSKTAYVPVETVIDAVDFIATFQPVSANGSGAIRFGTGRNSNTAGTYLQVEHTTSTDVLKVYLWNKSGSVATLAYTYNLPFTVSTLYSYTIRQGKRAGNLQIDITRSDGSKFSVNNLYQGYGVNFGAQWGNPTVYAYSGEVQISNVYFTTIFNRSPKLFIAGHSFVEGNYINTTVGGYSNRYDELVGNVLGKDQVAIAGHGGESGSSILTRLTQEIQWFRGAKYALLDLGANDFADTTTWKTTVQLFLTTCDSYNIIPILATVTPRSDGANNNRSVVLQQSAYIRSLGRRYVDFAKAVTVNGSGLYWRPGLCNADSVHANVAGNKVIANAILSAVPEIITGGPDTTAQTPHDMRIPYYSGTPTLNGLPNVAGQRFGFNATSLRLGVFYNNIYYDYEPFVNLINNSHTLSGPWGFNNTVKSSLSTAGGNQFTAYRNQPLSANAAAGAYQSSGNNSAGVEKQIASWNSSYSSNTSGSENGILEIRTIKAGVAGVLQGRVYSTGNLVLGSGLVDIPGQTNTISANGIRLVALGNGTPNIDSLIGKSSSSNLVVKISPTYYASTASVTAAISANNRSVSTITGATTIPALTATSDYTYIANNTTQVVLTLPTSSVAGALVRVDYLGTGGWKIAQTTGDKIITTGAVTTTGTSGFVASNGTGNSVMIQCVSPNTGSGGIYNITSSNGSPTIN